MFTLPAGDRADVPNLVVLITDGASDNMLRTNSEAFLAKRSSIHFVVVGVGNFVNIGELVTLANYPYTVNYLPASQVSALSNLTQATLDLVCNSQYIYASAQLACLLFDYSKVQKNKWLRTQ